MPNNPEVTFIICTYNRADYLDDTLNSLLRHNYSFDQFEILVVDNNSTDHTAETVKKYIAKDDKSYPSIRYVKEKIQGLSQARNRGIWESNAKNLVFVDDDIRAPGQFIPGWLKFFKEHPDIKAAGGRIHVQFDDPRPDWMPHFLLPLLGHHDLGDSIKKYGKMNYPFGGNMGFRKIVFERHGMFNTDLGRKGSQLKASEEKEFFQRIKKSNSDIYYLPDALLYHRVNKQRLTREYIRRQSIGLGQSIALQLKHESAARKAAYGLQEAGKMIATLGLFMPYTVTFQLQKAVMLVKFRKWIVEGYLSIYNTV